MTISQNLKILHKMMLPKLNLRCDLVTTISYLSISEKQKENSTTMLRSGHFMTARVGGTSRTGWMGIICRAPNLNMPNKQNRPSTYSEQAEHYLTLTNGTGQVSNHLTLILLLSSLWVILILKLTHILIRSGVPS